MLDVMFVEDHTLRCDKWPESMLWVYAGYASGFRRCCSLYPGNDIYSGLLWVRLVVHQEPLEAGNRSDFLRNSASESVRPLLKPRITKRF